MKISEINIDGFGKLQNFNIEFKNGFNIIYGNNEDGKSTLMAFVKMMFYGSPPAKKNEILKNPRKKYLPKNGGRMGGNIIFENENKSYRLEREFGASNSTDKIQLWNLTDNIKMPIPAKLTIGQMFFGFSASAFEKTFFINQIGTPIDDDDEINQRLSNLNSTGDESISSQKVHNRLLSAKESFKSKSGKVGKLDRRYIKLHEFEELLIKEERDETEKTSMMEKSNSLSDKIEYYENTYKIAVDKIDIQEKLARLERLKATASYQRTFDELSKQLAEKQSYLVSGDFTADMDFVKQCEETLETLKELEQKKLSMKSEFDRLKHGLENYSDDFIIDNEKNSIAEVQNKIMHLALEIKNINEEIASIRSKSTVLEEKLKNAEIDFHLAESNFRSVDSIYKQKILLAEQQLHTASTPKARTESPSDNKLNINGNYLFLSILILFAAIALSILVNPIFVFLVSLAIIVAIKALNLKNKKSKDKPFEYVDHLEIAKYTENLQKIRNAAEEEKTISKDNIDNAKKRISDFKSAISKLKYRIPELETKKNDIDSKIAELQRDKNDHEIKIAETTSSVNTQKEQIKYISSELSSIEANQNNIMRQMLAYFHQYKYVQDINEFYIQLNDLKSLFDEIDKIQIKIESHRQSAPMQHGSFSINQIHSQIQNLESLLLDKNNGVMPEKMDETSIEKLKAQTTILLNGINSCKEDYANINAVMKTKFKDSMGISHIEHEINIIKNEIEENEQYCNNLDTALKYIDEAASEMRQNFGSALNIKTAEILKKLTGGKYDSVIVSPDFNIAVKNNTSTIEWQYLSSGTIDQAYFSLRLAVADMLSEKNNSMPILIDDVFLQYDDIRTKQGLDFLDDYSQNSQIIFFTCHSHLIDMAVNQNLNVKISRISEK